MVKSFSQRNGYTLVEMSLVVAILAIVATMAPTLLRQIGRFYQSETTRINLQREGRDVTDGLMRFLRDAKASTVVIDQMPSQPPSSRLSFTTIQGGQMQYLQQGTKLLQTSQYGVVVDTSTLSPNLAVLTFVYPRSDDPTLISIGLTLQGAQGQVLELNVRKIHLMNP
jgi:prepilin-type N-terminal cleavage/methylation domain-containing protein